MYQTRRAHQSEVQPGTVLLVHGYEWVVDQIQYVPAEECESHPKLDKGCYRFTCHWSGNGPNPNFFNKDFTCGHREDLPISIKV